MRSTNLCNTAAILAMTLAGTTLAQADSGLEAGTYNVDTAHTFAHFKVKHQGLSFVRGLIGVDEGQIKIGDDPSNSQVNMTFDPKTLASGNDTRDQDLLGDVDGFFDVRKYPEITFRSTKVDFNEAHPDQSTVTGDLTLHGVTHSVELSVDQASCKVHPRKDDQYVCGFNAQTEIKRSDYDMDAMLPDAVGDTVQLSFEVEASKPVEKDN